MKKLSYKIGIFGILLSFLSSCAMDSDAYGNIQDIREVYEKSEAKYSAWGFVKVTGTDFYVETDSGKLLKAERPSSFFQIKAGSRVFIKFDIPQENSENKFDFAGGKTYTYIVKIGVLLPIDFDKIMKIDLGNESSSPKQKGYVKPTGIAISAHYLNMTVLFNKMGGEKNTFKLVYDKNKQKKNSAPILELLDISSSKQEPFEKLSEKLLSFDIELLEKIQAKNSEGKILFTVIVNRNTSWEKQYNLVYEP